MIERRFGAELRAEGSGRRIAGRVLTYGETARLPFGSERWEAGAVREAPGGAILNLHHRRDRPLARTGGGGLTLEDGPEALRMVADLPFTRDGDDALALVRAGVLRGLSVEFAPTAERNESGVRVIEGATVFGVGLVDRPAYPSSLPEVRQAGSGLRGAWRYDRTITVAATGKRRKVRIREGAFSHSLEDQAREITAQIGTSPAGTVGSRKAGSLKLTDDEEALVAEVAALPDIRAVRDFIEQLRSGLPAAMVPQYRVAPVPGASALLPEQGNPEVLIEEIREAVLFGVSFRIRPPQGAAADVDVLPPASRRAIAWL